MNEILGQDMPLFSADVQTAAPVARRSASTLPNRIAMAPRVPRSWAGSGDGSGGITSNHSRTIRKNEALTTSADSMALAAGGADWTLKCWDGDPELLVDPRN